MPITNLSSIIPASEIDTAMATDTEVADQLTQYIRKDYGRSFRAAPTSPQVLSPGVITKVNFGTVLSNVGSQFSSSRLTSLGLETWRLNSMILFDGREVTSPENYSRFIIWINKNGELTGRRICDTIIQPTKTVQSFFGLNLESTFTLSNNDYLEIAVLVSATNGKIFTDSNFNTCWWEGFRVG